MRWSTAIVSGLLLDRPTAEQVLAIDQKKERFALDFRKHGAQRSSQYSIGIRCCANDGVGWRSTRRRQKEEARSARRRKGRC